MLELINYRIEKLKEKHGFGPHKNLRDIYFLAKSKKHRDNKKAKNFLKDCTVGLWVKINCTNEEYLNCKYKSFFDRRNDIYISDELEHYQSRLRGNTQSFLHGRKYEYQLLHRLCFIDYYTKKLERYKNKL